MITQKRINEIGALLPFGAGVEVAKRAGVSDAMVSMLFNGKITNIATNSVSRIIAASIEVIHERNQMQKDISDRLEELAHEIANSKS